jgi:hypothetical protein
VEPDDESVKRWCEALEIKSVSSFTRDLGYFKMNVEKFGQMKEIYYPNGSERCEEEGERHGCQGGGSQERGRRRRQRRRRLRLLTDANTKVWAC